MIRMPAIAGVIARRLLVNYRVDPAAAERLMPAPFRPLTYRGYAIAGICLIRLEKVRPAGLPALAGIASENAAHRFAAEWDSPDGPQTGVFIPRRDTGSALNHLAGGRLFPGEHHLAKFEVADDGERVALSMRSDDESCQLRVAGHSAAELPGDSLFPSLAEASGFFQCGTGYSVTKAPGRFDGIRLVIPQWEARPFAVDELASSFFDDPAIFPRGAAIFDHALVMRGIAHRWERCGDLRCG